MTDELKNAMERLWLPAQHGTGVAAVHSADLYLVLTEVERLMTEGADCAENHYTAEEGRALVKELEQVKASRGADGYNGWADKATRRTNDCFKLSAKLAKSEEAAVVMREALVKVGEYLRDWESPRRGDAYITPGKRFVRDAQKVLCDALALLEEDK